MARELRFIDPAFRCAVVLSGTVRALYEAAKPEFDRLKGLRSLGLGAHLHEIARHTRHEHAVGLMRLFLKLCQQQKDKGLPKKFLWSFWPSLCFAQAGHAALSYDAEKAVLLACHLDAPFKDRLRTTLSPVLHNIEPCTQCKRQCQVRDSGKDQGHKWLEQMIDNNKWQRLHSWITALKLLQDTKLLKILRGQNSTDEAAPGFSQPEAFKMLLAPTCSWADPLRHLRRLDYVVRDLTYVGTVAIQLDVDTLIASANTAHSDWKLVNSLDKYLSETLYESDEAQTASVFFQRALAAQLISDRI